MKVLFIWKSGIKWFEKFRKYPYAIYDPKREKFLYGRVESEEEVLIVDDDVASGMTLFKVINDLKLKRYKIAAWDMGGTFKTDCPLPFPSLNAPVITFTGLAGVGKSFLAYAVSQAFNLPMVKWGDFAKPFAGKYGERLEEIEMKDPFFLARRVYEKLITFEPGKPVVLDNPKKEEQVIFIAFATRRPLVLIYVDVAEELREVALRVRGEEDDAYKGERDGLFKQEAEKLRRKAINIRIDSNDHSQAICLLKRHGFNFRGFYPDTLFYKPAILDWLLKVSYSPRVISPELEDGLKWIPEHYRRHYSERYTRLIKNPRRREIALRLSIAYRLIDDILDEHKVRNGRPAFHIERSVFEAIFAASLLIANAKAQLIGEEERRRFKKMTQVVYEAVSLELEFELSPEREPTKEEYLKTLEREAAFREFLFYLAGLDPERGWIEGLKAQAKDDLKGAQKHGRENTEVRLNRPAKKAREFLSASPLLKEVLED